RPLAPLFPYTTLFRSDLLAGRARLAVGQILGDGAEEQERLLQHQADVAAVVRYREGADVDAVQHDRAFRDVVKAADQVDQRALRSEEHTSDSSHQIIS